MPLGYSAANVNLITPQPETGFPNVTQSETFTTANPDNPNQIFVAYNDSRAAILLRSIFPAHRSQLMTAQLSPDSPKRTAKARSITLSVILLLCTTSCPALGLRSGSMLVAAVKAWAAISPQHQQTRIAGRISVFIPTAGTTGNLDSPITTHPRRFLGGCMFPGTTSTSAVALLRHLFH